MDAPLPRLVSCGSKGIARISDGLLAFSIEGWVDFVALRRFAESYKGVGFGSIDMVMGHHRVFVRTQWVRGERRDCHVISRVASRGPWRYGACAGEAGGTYSAI